MRLGLFANTAGGRRAMSKLAVGRENGQDIEIYVEDHGSGRLC
ncbi:hypothetical protein ABT065_37500 [Streptomyces sp. NPDC002764]